MQFVPFDPIEYLWQFGEIFNGKSIEEELNAFYSHVKIMIQISPPCGSLKTSNQTMLFISGVPSLGPILHLYEYS